MMRLPEDEERGALTSEATSRPVDEDLNIDPGRDKMVDDMLDLLLEALDGSDLRRTAMLMRAVYMRMDCDREADLDRLRHSTNQSVTRQ